MKEIITIVFIVVNIVNAKISLQVNVGENKNISIVYSGLDIDIITEEDVKLFNIKDQKIRDAVNIYYGKKPSNVYLKSPTPWGDLYQKYKWEQVKRVLKIKSARLKGISTHPTEILAQDFENNSNKTIKVNTGISHIIENSLTRSWSRENEITVSQEMEYDINVIVAEVGGVTSFSFATNWGVSEEKSESKTIGTNSGMEAELQPGQAVTAVLSANVGTIEVEVVHKAYLRGNLAVNYKKEYNGHHFYGPRIQDVMEKARIRNEVVNTEIVKFGFYVDASLKVFDKVTKKPL